jgi:membrane associated rhomboid family serine protease
VFSGWLLLTGLALKVGNEQLNGAGSLMPDLIDASVAIDSHLYGAIIGLIIGIVSWLKRQLFVDSPQP